MPTFCAATCNAAINRVIRIPLSMVVHQFGLRYGMIYATLVLFPLARGVVRMATVYDVAAYILGKTGRIPALKLQKLVYYSQAWSLVWDERPLFKSRIEAWANGPVSPALYVLHRGMYDLENIEGGELKNLSPEEIETIDAVLETYGNKPSQWLSDLTHSEDPWREARQGLADGQRGKQEITHASMAEYYSSL